MSSAFKRIKAGYHLTSFRAFKAHSTSTLSKPINESAFTTNKEFSELVKSHGARFYRLDTCLLEKSLARAFPSNQAKAITSVYFQTWKDAVQHLDSNFAQKEVEKEMLRDIKNQAQTRQEREANKFRGDIGCENEKRLLDADIMKTIATFDEADRDATEFIRSKFKEAGTGLVFLGIGSIAYCVGVYYVAVGKKISSKKVDGLSPQQVPKDGYPVSAYGSG